MDKSKELEALLAHIPKYESHRTSKLIITLPTTSEITVEEVNGIISKYVVPKGWDKEDVEISRRSGYSICKKCGKSLHIHIKSPEQTKCVKCGGNEFDHTSADVTLK